MTNPIRGADRERAGFIAEMLRLDIIDDEGFSRGDDGIYFDDVTEAAWKSWQAGRAAAEAGANVAAESMTDKLQRLQGDSIKHIARRAASASAETPEPVAIMRDGRAGAWAELTELGESLQAGTLCYAAQPAAATTSAVCTCPSGDGSLRWPCPQHPADTHMGETK